MTSNRDLPSSAAVPLVIPAAATLLIRFEAYDASDNLIVAVRAPLKVAATAAREWADLMDPYQGPGGLVIPDLSLLSWRDWLAKLLPFLRTR